MKKYETFTFQIPEFFMSALFNGDLSGLEDQDIQDFETFLDSVHNEFGNSQYVWNIPEDHEEPYFCRDNDVIKLAANCYDIRLTVFKPKKRG